MDKMGIIVESHKEEGYRNCQKLSQQGVRLQGPSWAPQPRGPALGRGAS